MQNEMSRAPYVRSGGNILVVDDVPSNIHMVSNILREEHNVFFATNGPDAIRLACERKPDLILLDIMMPDMDGYDVCQTLRENPETRDIPIIFVSALGEDGDEEKGLQMGAIDYFVKPLRPPIVRIRVRNHLELKRQRDILRDLSLFDELTGLANKRRFDETLDREWRRCQRGGQSLAVFACHLDHFRAFNEAAGVRRGDDCLRKVARTIAGYLCRPGDLAARYDETVFVAVLPETDLSGALNVAEQTRSAVEALTIEHPALADQVVTVSCGVSAGVPQMEVLPGQFMSFVLGLSDDAFQAGRNRVIGKEFSVGTESQQQA